MIATPGSSQPSTSFFSSRQGRAWMPGTSPGTTENLVARPLAIVEHFERFFQLRRDRDVELLAGRQAPDEPFVVERNKVAIRTELAEGAFHHGSELRLTLAEHDAVGIVGQIFAGNAKLVLRLVPRDQAVKQNVVGRERIGLLIREHLIGLLVIG